MPMLKDAKISNEERKRIKKRSGQTAPGGDAWNGGYPDDRKNVTRGKYIRPSAAQRRKEKSDKDGTRANANTASLPLHVSKKEFDKSKADYEKRRGAKLKSKK